MDLLSKESYFDSRFSLFDVPNERNLSHSVSQLSIPSYQTSPKRTHIINQGRNEPNKLNPISKQTQINIPTASQTLPRMKLPPGDLVGIRDDYNMICVPLYEASITGDWKSAKFKFDRRPELVRYSITENFETPLHIAVSAKCTQQGEEFVEKLVKLMERDDLELQNGNGETALCIAAVAGNVKMAKMMVQKNEAEITIPDTEGSMPLCKAALFGKHDMVIYLYDSSEKMTNHCWTYDNRNYVLVKCVEANLFDIALQIVEDCPELAPNGHVLRILAGKPDVFGSEHYTTMWEITHHNVKLRDRIRGMINSLMHDKVSPTQTSSALKLLRVIWISILKLHKDEISDILRGPPDPPKPAACKNQTREAQNPKYSSQILFVAAEKGNKTFVVELIRRYPDVVRMVNDTKQSIFHVAVSYRRKGIYSLLKEIGPIKGSIITLEDENGNNMLHLAADRAKSNQLQNVPGVVLQMQQELLWFKEVEAMLPYPFREKTNTSGLTPREVFTENHKDLVTKGEKWMKEVATQLMVVSTLIATVAFAVPFTVPGGFHKDTGTPIFLQKKLFTVFIILDALSLMFASTSLLYVVSILTARYAERDFLIRLPLKLMGCLETLFYALVAMMLTFVISFFIFYQNKSVGAPISIAVFAFLVFCFFSCEIYPLFSFYIHASKF